MLTLLLFWADLSMIAWRAARSLAARLLARCSTSAERCIAPSVNLLLGWMDCSAVVGVSFGRAFVVLRGAILQDKTALLYL